MIELLNLPNYIHIMDVVKSSRSNSVIWQDISDNLSNECNDMLSDAWDVAREIVRRKALDEKLSTARGLSRSRQCWSNLVLIGLIAYGDCEKFIDSTADELILLHKLGVAGAILFVPLAYVNKAIRESNG